MMQYSVTDFESTILVSRKGNDFVIEHLSTGKTVIIPSSNFYGSCFKYENEFLSQFASAFKDKNISNIILSHEASKCIMEKIHFNRIDN